MHRQALLVLAEELQGEQVVQRGEARLFAVDEDRVILCVRISIAHMHIERELFDKPHDLVRSADAVAQRCLEQLRRTCVAGLGRGFGRSLPCAGAQPCLLPWCGEPSGDEAFLPAKRDYPGASCG